jgi:translocator protein
MKNKEIKYGVVSFILVFLASVFGSLLTNSNSAWYESVRPNITPPNFVFPIVWTTLYILIGISIYFVFNSQSKLRKTAIFLFVTNLILNVLWSLFFFKLESPLFSFFILILIWISILALLFFTFKFEKKSFYLLIPYFIWISFAGVLNYLAI